MRVVALILFSIAVSGGGVALGQSAPARGGGFVDTQACMFSGPGQTAKLGAQVVEGRAPPMHDRMNDEIQRLARTDLRFGQAILDFFEASQQYDAARGRSEE